MQAEFARLRKENGRQTVGLNLRYANKAVWRKMASTLWFGLTRTMTPFMKRVPVLPSLRWQLIRCTNAHIEKVNDAIRIHSGGNFHDGLLGRRS